MDAEAATVVLLLLVSDATLAARRCDATVNLGKCCGWRAVRECESYLRTAILHHFVRAIYENSYSILLLTLILVTFGS